MCFKADTFSYSQPSIDPKSIAAMDNILSLLPMFSVGIGRFVDNFVGTIREPLFVRI